MSTNCPFHAVIANDERFFDNVDVVQTLFPDLTNQAELTRKAFEIAAKTLIEQQLKTIAGRVAMDDETDLDVAMALQFT